MPLIYFRTNVPSAPDISAAVYHYYIGQLEKLGLMTRLFFDSLNLELVALPSHFIFSNDLRIIIPLPLARQLDTRTTGVIDLNPHAAWFRRRRFLHGMNGMRCKDVYNTP